MAIIRIKRSVNGISAPSSLALGEVAVTIEESTTGTYSNLAGRLFVGNNSGTAVPIGGEYTYKLLDHQPSILTANSAALVGAAGTIDFWNVIGVTTTTTLKVPRNGYFATSGIGSLNVGDNNQFSVSAGGTVTATSFNFTGLTTTSVVLTDSNGNLVTDNLLRFYPSSQIFGGLLDVASAVTIAGTFTATNSAVNLGDVTASTFVSQSGIITNLTVGSSNYSFPTTVGSTGQRLEVASDGNLKFGTFDQQLNVIADSGTNSIGLSSEYFYIKGTDYEIETVSIGNTITIGLPDDILVGGGLTVAGNLTVNGNLTYLSSTITQIEDKNIELAVPETGSPSNAIADGGGVTVKGDSDYTISWSNSRSEWVFNQGLGPSSDSLNLGSSSTRWNTLFATRGDIVDLNVTGVSTFASFSVQAGSLNNVTVGLGTSAAARFTDVGFTTASGGDTTLRTLVVTGVSTIASLFITSNTDQNGVAYAGTSGVVGFSSAPTAGISTSTYILTSLGGVPVYTDTIDCGTY